MSVGQHTFTCPDEIAFASFKHYYGQVTALIFNAMKWLFDFQNAF
jgi:hypothetical protein